MLFLAVCVSAERMKTLSSLGFTDSPALLEAVRRHGNFAGNHEAGTTRSHHNLPKFRCFYFSD
jgi:hypothetical protein